MCFSDFMLLAACFSYYFRFCGMWHVACGRQVSPGRLMFLFPASQKKFCQLPAPKSFRFTKNFSSFGSFLLLTDFFSLLLPSGAGQPQKIIKIHSFDLQAQLSGAERSCGLPFNALQRMAAILCEQPAAKGQRLPRKTHTPTDPHTHTPAHPHTHTQRRR